MASVSATSDESEASVVRRVTSTGPGKSEWQFTERGLRFSSRFDGGNMAQVHLNPSGTFDVKVSEDAAAFGISTGYSTWFYFEVEREVVEADKATKQPHDLHLTLVNLNPQRGLFKNGYTIMYSSVEVVDEPATTVTSSCVFQDEKQWARLPTLLSFEKYTAPVEESSVHGEEAQGEHIDVEEGGQEVNLVKVSLKEADAKKEVKIRLSFSYKFKFSRERVRFAFCYPYTYTRVQEELASLDRQFVEPEQRELESSISSTKEGKTPSNMYYHHTRGVNLNRVYEDPQPELAPTENMVYLDLHAHANRRGCFIFGNNHLPDMLDVNNEAMETAIARQVQTQLYARLVGLHTPFFDYMACLFDKNNMTRHDLRDNSNATTSRQGSSRVALYRATGLTYVYTIECNYNEGGVERFYTDSDDQVLKSMFLEWPEGTIYIVELGGWGTGVGFLDWKAQQWTRIPGLRFILCVVVMDRLASAEYKLYTVERNAQTNEADPLPDLAPVRVEAPHAMVKFDSRELMGLPPGAVIP
ncbi:hypothetical protein JG687_00013115 [Phytophthora cactorum]|uniref:Cytosolic carboxypeptidase N-terminal domain-containing protein n=1 Tax=Phytophthora cactorum TaxID=29920 RepID=A0A8T1U229_9STRA|nr:hypothetical protein JG687_00013115 [Phytophthora cactorum]